jgi:hypothetical protein
VAPLISPILPSPPPRKNWLFAGSFERARRAALLYSFVQSCKLMDIPPFDYLKDVLPLAATHPSDSSAMDLTRPPCELAIMEPEEKPKNTENRGA